MQKWMTVRIMSLYVVATLIGSMAQIAALHSNPALIKRSSLHTHTQFVSFLNVTSSWCS